MKNFDKWNEVKKETQNDNVSFGFKNRDIFYIKICHEGNAASIIAHNASLKYALDTMCQKSIESIVVLTIDTNLHINDAIEKMRKHGICHLITRDNDGGSITL